MMKCPECKKSELLMFIKGTFESGVVLLGSGGAGTTGKIETRYQCPKCKHTIEYE